jgi:hypothetical protein
MLVEWLARGPAGGAATLALWSAAQAAREGGAVVVVDEQASFYPPAALTLGIALEQLVVVRPEGKSEHHWAIDQVLRSRGVAALWCWPRQTDDHMLRRWQLAAETSGVLGMLIRGPQARDEPSWAELRLDVQPYSTDPHRVASQATGRSFANRQRRLRVELVRARQAEAGKAAIVVLPCRDVGPAVHDALWSNLDETRPVHLASSLAPATIGRHSRRA